MTISWKPPELRISHVPIVDWAVGLLIVTGLVSLITWSVFGETSAGASFAQKFVHSLGWLAGSVFLAVVAPISGIRSGIFTDLTTVRINADAKYIEISETCFYRRKVMRYYFYQLDRFHSYKATRLGTKGYLLSLKLVNKDSVRLLIPLGTDKNATVKLIKALNRFALRNENQWKDCRN